MGNSLMKKKGNMSSKSVTLIFIAVALILAIAFSVVFIFAATTQNLTSNVTISYTATDVKGSVAMYAKKAPKTEFYTATESTNLVGEVEFDLETDTESDPKTVDLTDVSLSKQDNALYIHYVFTNNGDAAYAATLNFVETNMITQVNVGLSYSETGEEGSYQESDVGLVVLGNSTKHYYVMISIEDVAKNAEFDGQFKWELSSFEKNFTPEEEQGLEATTFTVVDKTTNTYSAKYNGQDISVNNTEAQTASFGAQSQQIDNIWYVPSSLGKASVVSVEQGENVPTNTKVVVAEGVTKIAKEAFRENTGLVEIVLPNSLATLENACFYKASYLTNVQFGTGLKEIKAHVFAFCVNLVELEIPEGVRTIGNHTFQRCTKLERVTFPTTLTSFETAYAFYYCTSLKEFNIPSCVNLIKEHAFEGCSALTEISIPEIVTSIGENAFKDCTGAKDITIPASVVTIRTKAFSGCTAVEELVYNANITIDFTKDSKVFENLGQNAANCILIIGEDVTTIRNYAFYNCSALTKISISKNVKSIGSKAFSGCTAVEELVYNANVITGFSEESKVFENLGQNAEKCVLTIGENATVIPDYILNGCNNLTSVTFSDSVKSIGCSAFKNCVNLTSVTFSDSVESIGRSAFENCANITSVVFGMGLNYIDMYAFKGCTNLISADFGENLDGWNGHYKYYECGCFGWVLGLEDENINSNNHFHITGVECAQMFKTEDLMDKLIAATYLTTTYAHNYWTTDPIW